MWGPVPPPSPGSGGAGRPAPDRQDAPSVSASKAAFARRSLRRALIATVGASSPRRPDPTGPALRGGPTTVRIRSSVPSSAGRSSSETATEWASGRPSTTWKIGGSRPVAVHSAVTVIGPRAARSRYVESSPIGPSEASVTA
jgi:hypothetical protein